MTSFLLGLALGVLVRAAWERRREHSGRGGVPLGASAADVSTRRRVISLVYDPDATPFWDEVTGTAKWWSLEDGDRLPDELVATLRERGAL